MSSNGSLLPATLQPGSGSTDLFLAVNWTYTGLFNIRRLVADEDFHSLIRSQGTQKARLGTDLESRFWIDPAHLLKAIYDGGVSVAEMDMAARGKIVADSTGNLAIQVAPNGPLRLPRMNCRSVSNHSQVRRQRSPFAGNCTRNPLVRKNQSHRPSCNSSFWKSRRRNRCQKEDCCL